MHDIPLSAAARERRLDYLREHIFDVVIIGGGITGVGVAREAALAGLRVALLEARDFASGTSSRSTKLFHGGLRYLERAEFLLVREGGREREGMQRLAPHLVSPLPFLLPVYRTMKYGRFVMGTAVWLYDRLANVAPNEQRVVLTRDEVLALEPAVNGDGLTGGVLYHEYLTDDARCVVTIARAAEQLGALVLNYARVSGLLYGGEHVVSGDGDAFGDARVGGVAVVDEVTGRTAAVRGRTIVNAAGPWIERIVQHDDEHAGRRGQRMVLHSRGVHVAVAHDRLPVKHAFAVQTPDGRLLFIIPRGDMTFVGTTDEAYEGDLYHPPIEERDVLYLLDLVNAVFPEAHIGQGDIAGQWSGVRPLVLEPGRSTKDVSRRDQVYVSESQLITIAGGKLTAWRRMAEEVMEHVHGVLARMDFETPAALRARATELSPVLPLPGGLTIPPRGRIEWELKEAKRLARFVAMTEKDAAWLCRRYGDEAERVALHARARGLSLDRIAPDVPLLHGELSYLIEHEGAVQLADVIVRRTGLAWFGGPAAQRALPLFARAMGALRGWDEEEYARQVSDCRQQAYWPIDAALSGYRDIGE